MAQNASTVAERQAAALDTILKVLARHDSEASERIQALFGRGARKWSVRSGAVGPQDEFLLILAEAVASLSKLVDQQRDKILSLEESSAKPRPRGRPRKPEIDLASDKI
jgi:hypothetical protein